VNDMNVGVIGGSGYVGGELVRLLLFHPDVTLNYVGSRQYAGEFVYRIHPNLRGLTKLTFEKVDFKIITDKTDLVFTAVPHGSAMDIVPDLLSSGLKVIDLSADYRLKNPDDYVVWYGFEHKNPNLLEKSVYGLPELFRDEIRKSNFIANPGCTATATSLALAPIIKAFDVDASKIVVDVKIGSSGSGFNANLMSIHSERTHVVRAYKPIGHRHTAEVEQIIKTYSTKNAKISMSVHAVDMVRGILSTNHIFLNSDNITQADVWKIYRNVYGNEPFIRLIADKKGLYRLPDPKIVTGTNYCDIGFAYDKRTNRLVVLAAIDNLMKGAAGQAIQNMNIMLGVSETAGLLFSGFHPI